MNCLRSFFTGYPGASEFSAGKTGKNCRQKTCRYYDPQVFLSVTRIRKARYRLIAELLSFQDQNRFIGHLGYFRIVYRHVYIAFNPVKNTVILRRGQLSQGQGLAFQLGT